MGMRSPISPGASFDAVSFEMRRLSYTGTSVRFVLPESDAQSRRSLRNMPYCRQAQSGWSSRQCDRHAYFSIQVPIYQYQP